MSPCGHLCYAILCYVCLFVFWPAFLLSLSILIFGGEKKIRETDRHCHHFALQEICAHAAAADGAHIVCARHAGPEDEVNTGPQRTEKQVESGI